MGKVLENKRGISLIVLVITIIIMIILASVVILSLTGSGIIYKAKQSQFNNDIKEFESEYLIWANQILLNNPSIDLSKVYATENGVIGLEGISGVNNITDIITSLKNDSKYADKIIILNGKVRTNDKNLSSEELEYSINIGFDSSSNYVKSGLILNYDGINNIGIGHSDDTNVWENLNNSGKDLTLFNFNYNIDSGWVSNGLRFDGSGDYAATNKSYDFANDFQENEYTLEADIVKGTYINIGEFGTYGETILANSNSKNYFSWLTIKSSEVGINSFNNIAQGHQYTTGANVQLGGKYHIQAVIKSGSLSEILVNGVLVNSFISAAVNTSNIGYFTLGDLRAGRDIRFCGDIRSIRLYNRLLTGDELIQNYEIEKIRYEI